MKRSGHLPMSNSRTRTGIHGEPRGASAADFGRVLDPMGRLRCANVGDTIVMFGSARIQPRDKALTH